MKHYSIALSFALLTLCGTAAQAQVAVVMAPGAAPPSKEQIANLYRGRSFELNLLDLPEGSPARDKFYRDATDREPAQAKAGWARVVFAGKGLPPKQVSDATAVKAAVNADPKAVGYVEKSAVDSSVKVVLTLE